MRARREDRDGLFADHARLLGDLPAMSLGALAPTLDAERVALARRRGRAAGVLRELRAIERAEGQREPLPGHASIQILQVMEDRTPRIRGKDRSRS